MSVTTKSATIGKRGQITLPIEIRRHLGLTEGDRVEFVDDAGRIAIRRSSVSPNPFEKYLGILPACASKREAKTWIRSLRDED